MRSHMDITTFVKTHKITITGCLLIIATSLLVIYSLLPKQTETPPIITVQEKKARFFKLIVPAVDAVHLTLTAQYQRVSKTLSATGRSKEIDTLKKRYKVNTDEALLMALKPHSKSIAIAQAAMESSWATSRFFNEANNIFGVWSFNKSEPRIAALEKRGDKTIWVKKYQSIEESIADYYLTLGRSEAFIDFRQTKMLSSDPLLLVTKLDRYSEKGSEYGKELTAIIKFNQLTQYD